MLIAERNGIMAKASDNSELPRGFREVKFLDNHGTAYLRVNLPASEISYQRIKCFIQYPQSGSYWGYAIGNYGSGDGYTRRGSVSIQQSWNGQIVVDALNCSGWKGTPSRTTLHEIDAILDGGTFSVFVDSIKMVENIASTTNYKRVQFIFATERYEGDSACAMSNCYLGRIEYWNSTSKPYASLIPCVREADEKPGMWDKERLQFFTNQAISGEDFGWVEIG